MPNHLQGQTSPYLLQHVDNPVDWYPWGELAFSKAKAEDKPIFLSIGYSTCHWCHVMAHESFEDEQVARLLNDNFVAIKVDREERPDVDSIYMSACQAFGGSGGWPASIFITAQQQPFFAGSYYPKRPRFGSPGFIDLLTMIAAKWRDDRPALLSAANQLTLLLRSAAADVDYDTDNDTDADGSVAAGTQGELDAGLAASLLERAYQYFRRSYDALNGGFGPAPKFPAAHNLLFLLQCYHKNAGQASSCKALSMVERTLEQMYRGGLFDHIGGGFCRYATDDSYLIPHFEKMLYDNALLIMAYAQAYEISGRALYLDAAQRSAAYIERELTAANGGFYSAQDADSQGEEGKYYLFRPQELLELLGQAAGERFNRYYDITPQGNFAGQNIPNLLSTPQLTHAAEAELPRVYQYRCQRMPLELDDKQLCVWNSLSVSALCRLYRVSGRSDYLQAAQRAQQFLGREMGGDAGRLRVSWRRGKSGAAGFVDDYAAYAKALLDLHQATLDDKYLHQAARICRRAVDDFADSKNGGFYLYGKQHEQLLLRPKQSYDGALPSGNSLMARCLVQLSLLLPEEPEWSRQAELQLSWLCRQAADFPAGQTVFLLALSDYLQPPPLLHIAAATEQQLVLGQELPCRLPLSTLTRLVGPEEAGYPLLHGRTTYYLCRRGACLPPLEQLPDPEQLRP